MSMFHSVPGVPQVKMERFGGLAGLVGLRFSTEDGSSQCLQWLSFYRGGRKEGTEIQKT